MFLSELELKNYRNYQTLHINFSPRVNIFFGQNAQGKTNILEAAGILSLGRSFRTKKDVELIRWEQEFCFVKGIFTEDPEIELIEIGIGNNQKKIKINRQEKKNNELFGLIPVVIFSPEDLQLIKGGPQNRRDFIDLYLAQVEPNYRNVYYNFQRILQQRNRFLKDRYHEKTELEVWNNQLVEHGTKVICYRAELIEKVKPYIKNAHLNISNENEIIDLEYLSVKGLPVKDQTEAQLKELFYDELHALRRMEIDRKMTLVGPQRDDLRLTIGNAKSQNQVELRNFGSQGQQRTAALALKLGLVEIITEIRGKTPLLLLDDVMSEFDDTRKKALLKMLLSSSQTFLTSTSKQDFPIEDLQTLFFEVNRGEVLNAS